MATYALELEAEVLDELLWVLALGDEGVQGSAWSLSCVLILQAPRNEVRVHLNLESNNHISQQHPHTSATPIYFSSILIL